LFSLAWLHRNVGQSTEGQSIAEQLNVKRYGGSLSRHSGSQSKAEHGTAYQRSAGHGSASQGKRI